jgi:hypothetical protein
MKIGIVTFVKCGNYGADLQAYALVRVINNMGYDAEVIDIEKEYITAPDTVRNAIKGRFEYYGYVKGLFKILQLIKSKYEVKKLKGFDPEHATIRNERFNEFFAHFIKHSVRYYSLTDLRNAVSLPWDLLITGSDQVWNFRQTNYLDVYFLDFAKRLNKKAFSYAASFGFSELPNERREEYKKLLEGLDAISVRESNGIDIVASCTKKKAVQVLDPTLLLSGQQWMDAVGWGNYGAGKKRLVIIYTITGSKYCYRLAKSISKHLKAEIVNIKGDYSKVKENDDILHIKDAGPREFVMLMGQAVYVITDSFHGTAFSINFNVPFTTLLNPVSRNNSRAISLLKMLHLTDRYIYDDGSNRIPDNLEIDFSEANRVLFDMRKLSNSFLKENIKML